MRDKYIKYFDEYYKIRNTIHPQANVFECMRKGWIPKNLLKEFIKNNDVHSLASSMMYLKETKKDFPLVIYIA